MTWSPCVTGAAYTLLVDWNGNGVVAGIGDDVTEDVLGDGSWTAVYGRDQSRQLSPGRVGVGSFVLCNADRVYSPENPDSPLADDLGPGRDVFFDASLGGVDFPLFRGRIDDFVVHPDRGDRTADFTVVDGLAQLQTVVLSTPLFSALRTGQVIEEILDQAEWPADRRDIDVGATFMPFWWAEEKNALTAVQEMVLAEGPPAIAYIEKDGTFVFRDRHHRILRPRSLNSQASYAAARVACDAPAVTGLSYTAPFRYETGWRDIINVVGQDVTVLTRDPYLQQVWSTDSPFSILPGQTVEIRVQSSQPFEDATAPTTTGSDPDIIWSGTGIVSATLSRTSGQGVIIRVTSVGGPATVTFMRLRARPLEQVRTVAVQEEDTASSGTNGPRFYPLSIPFATLEDVRAVALVILANYAMRRPAVQMRVVSCDPEHLLEIFVRTVSDRITIRNDELGLDSDFFVENVSHTIRRIGPDSPPVHAVVLGCEKTLPPPNDNPFTFDKPGAGFDDGFFDPLAADNPNSVWIWDTQSDFDVNEFAT